MPLNNHCYQREIREKQEFTFLSEKICAALPRELGLFHSLSKKASGQAVQERDLWSIFSVQFVSKTRLSVTPVLSKIPLIIISFVRMLRYSKFAAE